MLDTVKKWVPITYDAFMDYRVGGTEVSAKGKALSFKNLLKVRMLIQIVQALSKREWNELNGCF